MISTALNASTIRLNVNAKNWEDAARKAGDLLLKNKSINEEYIESMVQSVHEFGPYIVIAPGIALFHARPESNVYEICLSMLTLQTPVEFGAGDKDPVDLIFALGAIDHDSHLQLMAGLMKVLQDNNLLESIRKAQSVEQVIKLINYKLEE
ncbi:PTS sugar transporter subunit IIA [Virgibacillus pantothenticus]|uniref:Ascorbate-specific PTS system EIIA component n=1 Tax=Virgibacillus pantothenticus TaxID=1473 RepID=A0A0L0QUP2_VIRPA|nr:MULTISPECIES: PTS sugar transporter subunit IIA [Virgibacillus]API92541.1 hypothetical protein BKP57_12425 [Virgibacillus sp. 6R]KNE22286.1 hypothetical protein AFK71_01210 [Virgibacillus pantothenticus]MBS7428020.1 PTS sugar transporter subunit IIA [Virgibacillus sp. 19R1-5]MBU8568572.1 PTS sugar transporter subunit IIA [Virgibacillus pantothenticus]MBU8602600.1 PTS sugar transporter subunit IIA [Virgibacillus pantothenticus]